MTKNYKEHSEFYQTALLAVILSIMFAAAGVAALLFAPKSSEPAFSNAVSVIEEPLLPEERIYAEEIGAKAQNISWIENKAFFSSFSFDSDEKSEMVDKGLQLYRNPSTRAAVEWFYLRVTGNRDVTMAVLDAANREDIPLSLAFALCHTESRYNRYAYNLNANGSIDRGLFQLNDRSFPQLGENDFYAVETSARLGMKHLRFCMNVAGNDLTAVAMYNAGVSRVRNDQTPASTLRYVSRIASYRANLQTAFTEEVLNHYKQSNETIIPAIAR
ncbi:MAG: transglycosylase SLT domain-containing protein [Treponema sp.]|nr:transglycosylase SLT domain-containing protein [Treponema sp.]MEE3435505.1 transglycosylase SLT domain-containing protein [Treponema sp.]